MKASERHTPLRRPFLIPLALGALVLPAATLASVEARLSVSSDPPGAAVYLDGEVVGETPTGPRSLSPGAHTVRLVKAGFIESQRSVDVAANTLEHIQVDLQLAEPDRSARGRSGRRRSLWLAAGGATATAGALLLSAARSQALPPEGPPTGGSVSVDPNATARNRPGFAGVTHFVLSTGGWTDLNGDSLTFIWDFGDGARGVGQSVGHTYASRGAHDVRLEVSDGYLTSENVLRLYVEDVSGRWSGGVPFLAYRDVTLDLVQEGQVIRGVFTSPKGSGAVIGHALPPRHVSLTLQLEGEPIRQNLCVGAVSDFLDRIEFGDYSLERQGQ